jgi:hypothetical protein
MTAVVMEVVSEYNIEETTEEVEYILEIAIR